MRVILKKSLEKLEAAHALYATPITALEVARGRALVGKLRGAIEVLESIERLPVKPNESAKAASARTDARALMAQYRVRTPKLLFHVASADVHVWVDGEVVPDDALGTPWLVDPGAHHVEAARGDQRAGIDVRVAEGEQRDVTPKLEPAPQVLPAPVIAAPLPEPKASTGSPNVVAYVGFGVGGVGVALGSITGIITLARASDIKAQCRNGICPSSAGLDSAQTIGTVSTVAFIAGGVGLGVGALALVLAGDRHAPRTAKNAWLEPWTSGSMIGVRGGF